MVRMSKPQQAIATLLKKYVDEEELQHNYLHPELLHASGHKAELDIWIERMKIGIEYNGEHHYHKVKVFNCESLEDVN